MLHQFNFAIVIQYQREIIIFMVLYNIFIFNCSQKLLEN
jgi:hypothetical protein